VLLRNLPLQPALLLLVLLPHIPLQPLQLRL
jgi:hypothetical protein